MFCVRSISAGFRKLLPTIVLLVVAGLAGATDVFSAQVRELFSHSLHERFGDLMPMAINSLIVAIMFNIAYLLYHPVVCGLERVLGKTTASDRGKSLIVRCVKLLYWLLSSIAILSVFFPEMMGKMVLGFSVFGAALTLALQSAANSLICGVLMQLTNRVRPGDRIKTVGIDVEGTVEDIGYLSTLVRTNDNGLISIPNKALWEAPVKHLEPSTTPAGTAPASPTAATSPVAPTGTTTNP